MQDGLQSDPPTSIPPPPWTEVLFILAISLGWPAAAAVSLAYAVGGSHTTSLGLLLIACSVSAAYGLDRLVDRRGVEASRVRKTLMVVVVCTSLAGAALACTALWRIQVCALLAILAAGYVPLKRVLPKNVLTVPAWAIAVCALPFATAPDFSGHYLGAALAVALIMATNTILCDLPDVESDTRAGVVAVAVRLGAKPTAILCVLLSSSALAISFMADKISLAACSGVLLEISIAAWLHGPRPSLRQFADAAVAFIPGPLAFLLQRIG